MSARLKTSSGMIKISAPPPVGFFEERGPDENSSSDRATDIEHAEKKNLAADVATEFQESSESSPIKGLDMASNDSGVSLTSSEPCQQSACSAMLGLASPVSGLASPFVYVHHAGESKTPFNEKEEPVHIKTEAAVCNEDEPMHCESGSDISSSPPKRSGKVPFLYSDFTPFDMSPVRVTGPPSINHSSSGIIKNNASGNEADAGTTLACPTSIHNEMLSSTAVDCSVSVSSLETCEQSAWSAMLGPAVGLASPHIADHGIAEALTKSDTALSTKDEPMHCGSVDNILNTAQDIGTKESLRQLDSSTSIMRPSSGGMPPVQLTDPPSIHRTLTKSKTILPQGLLEQVTKKVQEGEVSLPSADESPIIDLTGKDPENTPQRDASKTSKSVIECSMNNSRSQDANHTKTLQRTGSEMSVASAERTESFSMCCDDPMLFPNLDESVDEDNRGSTSDVDVSVLFSEKFDRAYKKYAKEKKRKLKKKRKRDDCTVRGEEGDEDCKEKKQKTTRPNYFVAIQITNEKIKERIKKTQGYILAQKKQLSPAMVSAESAHLTVLVMYLQNQEDIDKATEILDECGRQVRELLTDPLVLQISEIASFKDQVVFAKVQDGETHDKLEQLADAVTKCYDETNLGGDGKGFKAHITLLKLSKAPKLRKKGIKRVNPSLYSRLKEKQFGSQPAMSLQLCAMLKPKDEHGYFHVTHSVPLVPEDYVPPCDDNENLDKEWDIMFELVPLPEAKNFTVELENILKWSFKTPEKS